MCVVSSHVIGWGLCLFSFFSCSLRGKLLLQRRLTYHFGVKIVVGEYEGAEDEEGLRVGEFS